MPTTQTLSPKYWASSPGGDAHDRMLWVSFKKGNREALDKLYKKHVSGMYHHGMFVCRDPEMVRDGMQDLFSRLWMTRRRISDAASVQTYLYKSLQRIILLQVIRKRKESRPFEDATHAVDLNNTFEQTIVDREIRKERLMRVRKELETLSSHQREVILLRFFNGLAYPQIAEIMGMHIESVYNLSSKAIEHLRVRLESSPSFA